ncbi:hypothetical protein ALPO108162_08280 [Alicyclobacillus pomorum]
MSEGITLVLEVDVLRRRMLRRFPRTMVICRVIVHPAFFV